MQIRHEPRPDGLRLCRDCLWARAVNRGPGQPWQHECVHIEVIRTHPDVLANWREPMAPGVLCVTERVLRRIGAACGVGARLWEAAVGGE